MDRTQTDQYRRLRATLIGGIAPLLLLFLAASAWQELSERQAALRAAESETAALTRALAERIVKRHGERIWAQAAPGAGATFWFTMPD